MSGPQLVQCRKSRRDPEVDLELYRTEPPKRDPYGKVVTKAAKKK